MFQFSIEKIERLFPKPKEEFSFRYILQRLFLDDWLMKLIALIITLALWLGVTGLGTTTEERIRNVEIKLRVSNEMEITNSPQQEVDLVVVGDKRKINQIRREDLKPSLDLVDTPPGDRTIELTPETVNLQLPTGVKLKEIQPSKIPIKLEMVESREIPVKAEIANNVPDGFEIYGVSVIPQKVPARGPASYINSIQYISTEKIDVKDRREDFTAPQVPLNIANPKVRVIEETAVDVFFRIGEKRIERLFIVPVKNEKEERTATIVLYGARSLLNALRSEDIQIQSVKTDLDDDSLSLTLPPGVQEKVEVRKMQLNGR
ncbi:MAG: CdaR family protein [Pyrinomonadaceae bacterium]